MSTLLERITGHGERSSAATAKERLQLVLIHDRSDISPGLLNAIKDEIVQVLSKHIDVDPSVVDLHISSEGREQRLVADIPLPSSSRRRRSS
jgi:cell division topological specificity factor